MSAELKHEGDTAFYEAGGVKWYPQADGGPMHTSPPPVPAISPTTEEGTCALCGQVMIRTADDCWHPWYVEKACPPEPPGNTPAWREWRKAGNQTLRPGREHWRDIRE